MAQDSRSPQVPTIPMPSNDLAGLYSTALATKQAVERLQGTQGLAAGAPRMIVSPSAPAVTRDGDFWLSAGAASVTLSVSVSGRWFAIGLLT